VSPNEKKEEHSNPLFAKTDGFTAAPGWGTPSVEEQPPVVLQIKSPPIAGEPVKKQIPTIVKKRGNQPSTHVMDSEIPYEDRHRKITMMLDKRLGQAFRAYLRDKEYGSSQGARFNHLIFMALSQVYEMDPKLLEQEFTYEVLMSLPDQE
jgi:hypothetical protein